MKWPLFENKMRKSLLSHQSAVDADAIWAAIEPQVDAINRRKKRRFLFFWFLLPLLLASGSAVYFHSLGDAVANEGKTPVKTGIPAVDKDKEAYVVNSNKVAINEDDFVKNIAQETAQPSPNNDALKPLNKPVLNAAVNSSIISSNKQNEPLPSTSENHIEPSANSLTPNVAELEAPIAEQPTLEQAKTLFATPNEEGSLILETVPYPPCQPLAPNSHKAPESSVVVLDVPSPPLRKRDFRLDAALLCGISFIDREMTARDSSQVALLDNRERSERALEAVQLGIRLGMEHRSGLGFSTGLNYVQVNEVYSNNSTVTSLDTVYGIQYYQLNFEDDTIPVYGDIVLERLTTHRKEIYNKYRMIEVPLLLGWRHVGHQFTFGVQAGAFVNLRMMAKGQAWQTDTEDIDFSNGDIYRTNIGLSYYLGLTAGFMLNEQTEVFASPFVRHFPKSITKAAYGLEQRYKLYGLSAGLRYQF